MPPYKAAFRGFLLFLLGVLALLISNTAAGLASRLAGSLALAASAVLCAVTQIACFNRFDMLHDKHLRKNILIIYYNICRRPCQERSPHFVAVFLYFLRFGAAHFVRIKFLSFSTAVILSAGAKRPHEARRAIVS